MVDQLVDVLQFFDTLVVAAQVIAVAKVSRGQHPAAYHALRAVTDGTVGESANSLLLRRADR